MKAEEGVWVRLPAALLLDGDDEPDYEITWVDGYGWRDGMQVRFGRSPDGEEWVIEVSALGYVRRWLMQPQRVRGPFTKQFSELLPPLVRRRLDVLSDEHSRLLQAANAGDSDADARLDEIRITRRKGPKSHRLKVLK